MNIIIYIRLIRAEGSQVAFPFNVIFLIKLTYNLLYTRQRNIYSQKLIKIQLQYYLYFFKLWYSCYGRQPTSIQSFLVQVHYFFIHISNRIPNTSSINITLCWMHINQLLIYSIVIVNTNLYNLCFTLTRNNTHIEMPTKCIVIPKL